MKGEVKEKGTEIASKDEQVAQLKLGNKELTDLQEELQAKNQQVKQYKKQVDSYKTELERCQKELERCQGELERCHGELKHLQEWVGVVSLSNRNTHCTLPLCVMPRYLCLPNWVRPST